MEGQAIRRDGTPDRVWLVGTYDAGYLTKDEETARKAIDRGQKVTVYLAARRGQR